MREDTQWRGEKCPEFQRKILFDCVLLVSVNVTGAREHSEKLLDQN